MWGRVNHRPHSTLSDLAADGHQPNGLGLTICCGTRTAQGCSSLHPESHGFCYLPFFLSFIRCFSVLPIGVLVVMQVSLRLRIIAGFSAMCVLGKQLSQAY